MFLAYFLGFITLLSGITDSGTLISEQVEKYLEGIKKEQNVDLNFWALNELYNSNCDINRAIDRQIAQSNLTELRKIFNEFQCKHKSLNDSINIERLKAFSLQQGSFSIALFYLSHNEPQSSLNEFYWEFEKKWKDKISLENLNSLKKVKDRIPIDPLSLFNMENYLPLYSLLYSDYSAKFFSQEDYGILLKHIVEISKEPSDGVSINDSILYYLAFNVFYNTNQYQLIANLFNDLNRETTFPNSKRKVRILSGIDYSLSISGNYYEALHFERNYLIPLAEYYKLKETVDYVKLQQSANLYDLGKYEEARKILEELYNDPNSYVLRSELYNNLSLCYQKLGQKNKYTEFLLQAIQEAENNQNPPPDFYIVKLGLYRNLFVYYNSIGDLNSALPFIDKAKRLAEQNKNYRELGSIYYYLGNYYWENFENADKALAEYSKAEQRFVNVDNYRRKMLLLASKASLLIDIDSLQQAESVVKQMKKAASSNTDAPRYIKSLIYSGKIALAQNNLHELEAVISDLSIYSLNDLEFETLIDYHNLYATFLHRKGETQKAFDYLEPVIAQVIERAQGSVDSQTGFWTVEKEYLDTFELMISILMESGNQHESLVYLDKLKTINDASLYNNPILKGNKLTEQELAQAKKLTSQIQALRNQYLSTTTENQPQLKTEIDQLSAQRQELTNKVTDHLKNQDIPVWKVQQQMNSDELILHFTELNKTLYISVISKNEVAIRHLPITDNIQNLLSRTANALASRKTSLSDLYQIYQLLELNNIPQRINQLSVIPDNELYRIPLEVLPVSKPNSSYSFGSASYMIERFNFKYFTSLKDFANNNRNTLKASGSEFSAFAISYFDDFQKNLPSLPFATIEAKKIEQVLSSFKNKQVFSGNNATETAFHAQLSNSHILHVATHSEVSSQDPLFSTIYLKSHENGSVKGGVLYAYELFDNELNNDLIMLNSCSSGSGNYLQGAGIMGISRALRYAGAKSLALNLWEVNDKVASEFATDFYSFLNEGHSKSSAMRLAKINQLKTGSADPHYWGAYTLIGNSNPVIKKPASSKFVLPLMVTISLLVGYRVRKNSTDDSF